MDGFTYCAGREKKKREEVVVGGKRDVPLDSERNTFFHFKHSDLIKVLLHYVAESL